MRGLSPIVGRIHVYSDNRLQALYPEFAITINGEPYADDGFYASFESMLKIDSSSHRRETAWAESQGHSPPSRNRPEEFLWGPGIDIKGRWIGSQLRGRCPERHRINVNREDLRQTIERANPGQTLFL